MTGRLRLPVVTAATLAALKRSMTMFFGRGDDGRRDRRCGATGRPAGDPYTFDGGGGGGRATGHRACPGAGTHRRRQSASADTGRDDAATILQKSLNACYRNPEWIAPVFEPDLLPDGDSDDGKQIGEAIRLWNRARTVNGPGGGSYHWTQLDRNDNPIVA
ncbi:hypothetical protein [Micromonospora chersina]|uniref:hypothetical protein n=1 Tax=Micromonospora chersina TaxID=47854 RepID=UPI003404DBE2